MRKRRIIAATVVSAAMVLSAAQPAAAGTVTHTAPYDVAKHSTTCTPYDGAICRTSATADKTTGEIAVSSELEVAALSSGSGLAQANGEVTDTVRTTTKSRSIRVTATVAVASASAALDDPADRARAQLTLHLFVWCSGCADGYAIIRSIVPLVDADPGTATPSQIQGETRTVTAEFTLSAGQKFNGNGSATVEAGTQAGLNYRFLSPKRIASASANVDVLSIESVTA